MDNQHRKITGYREFDETEIEKINAIKRMGEEFRCLVEKLDEDTDLDKRWAAIAKTHFQQGLMALTRAVAKPDSF